LENRWPPEEAEAGAMVEVAPWIHHHHTTDGNASTIDASNDAMHG